MFRSVTSLSRNHIERILCMPVLPAPKCFPSRPPQAGTLMAANGAAVGGLYLTQALLQPAAANLPPSAWLALVPLATLAGYGGGVSLIAFGPASSCLPISRHLGGLALAFVAAAMAPTAPLLALAAAGVGLGAAVAQRLLAAAAHLAGPAAAGSAIGRVVACGLMAVLLVKLLGAGLADRVGWRGVCVAAAGCAVLASLLLRRPSQPVAAAAPRVTAVNLWCSSALLRRIAWQQAALFAAFQASWLIALTALPPSERFFVVMGGGSVGLLAALQAGSLADRADPGRIVLAGSAAIAVSAAVILPLGYGLAVGPVRTVVLLAGMACVDAGLQVALVANQARAQAIRPDLRSRCAALLTVAGSLGGGLGGGAAYWLYLQAGWAAALALVAGLANVGVLLSLWPLRRVSKVGCKTN